MPCAVCLVSQEALTQEDEIVHALAEPGCLYSDSTFPASAESLYRTPQQPPPGAMPPSLAVWARISRQEVRGCHSPVTFPTGAWRYPKTHPCKNSSHSLVSGWSTYSLAILLCPGLRPEKKELLSEVSVNTIQCIARSMETCRYSGKRRLESWKIEARKTLRISVLSSC